MRVAGFVLLAAMTAPALAVQDGAWMVGTWFGSGQPHDTGSMYIDRMRPDGSWRGEYRTCRKGNSEDLVQEGTWQVHGDLLVLQVRTVGGTPMPRTDTYRVLSHSTAAQKYVE